MPVVLDRTLDALADAHRRRVVELLRREPMRSSDIAAALRLSRPATSRHLGVLRRSGLVAERSDENDARVRVYRLRRRPFLQLQSWLEEVAAFWDDQLAACKRHAGGPRKTRRRGPGDARRRDA